VLFGILVATFSILAGTFWDWLTGPHGGLCLWSSDGCPALKTWNTKHGEKQQWLPKHRKL